jgi:hypothetical protein
LARRLGISGRLIKYWASSRRPVSVRHSSQIAKIARQRHDRRVERVRARYVAMVGSLDSASARAVMLAMVVEEIEVRVDVADKLARQDAAALA